MGKVMKYVLLAIIAIPCTVLLLYFGVRAIAVLQKGYSWHEMDWDGDSATSISEFFASSDIGTRLETVNGVECVIYYDYKDGSTVKTVC